MGAHPKRVSKEGEILQKVFGIETENVASSAVVVMHFKASF